MPQLGVTWLGKFQLEPITINLNTMWQHPVGIWLRANKLHGVDISLLIHFRPTIFFIKLSFTLTKLRVLCNNWCRKQFVLERVIRYKSGEILASWWRLCFKSCPNIHYTIRISLILRTIENIKNLQYINFMQLTPVIRPSFNYIT